MGRQLLAKLRLMNSSSSRPVMLLSWKYFQYAADRAFDELHQTAIITSEANEKSHSQTQYPHRCALFLLHAAIVSRKLWFVCIGDANFVSQTCIHVKTIQIWSTFTPMRRMFFCDSSCISLKINNCLQRKIFHWYLSAFTDWNYTRYNANNGHVPDISLKFQVSFPNGACFAQNFQTALHSFSNSQRLIIGTCNLDWILAWHIEFSRMDIDLVCILFIETWISTHN